MTALMIIAPIIVALGIGFLFAISRKENKRKNEALDRRDFVIRSSYTWGVIMVTIEAVLLSLVIFGNIDMGLPLGVNIVLGVLLVAFAFGALQIFREKVRVVERNEVIHTPVIGKTKRYTFKEINRVDMKRTGVYAYVNNKRIFTLDSTGIGTSLFVEIYRLKE